MWTVMLLVLGADPTSVTYLEINLARIENDVLPVRRDLRLDYAAELQCEWLNYAYKRNEPIFSDHLCNTDWLFVRHPELDWYKLFATFPSGVPEWITLFDVGRLCGYPENNGSVIDNGYYGGRNDNAVDAWLRSSDGHRENLLDPDWEDVGIAMQNVTGGNFATWALFGKEE